LHGTLRAFAFVSVGHPLREEQAAPEPGGSRFIGAAARLCLGPHDREAAARHGRILRFVGGGQAARRHARIRCR